MSELCDVVLEELRSKLCLSYLAEMERVQDHVQEECKIEINCMRSKMEASSALDLEKKERQLSTLHDLELEELKAELQQLSAEIDCIQSDVEEERKEAINLVHSEIKASSALDLKEIERQLSASHTAELEELRTELQQSSLTEIPLVTSSQPKTLKILSCALTPATPRFARQINESCASCHGTFIPLSS